MAHRRHHHHHRRNLAAPPPSSSTVDPTTTSTSTPSHYFPSPKPDLTKKNSSLLHHFSSLNLSHNHPHKDSNFKPKSLTSSTILHSSKPHHSQNTSKLEKDPSQKLAKKTPKEKPPQKASVKNEKRDDFCVSSKGLFGDDVVKRNSVSSSLALSGGRRRSFCGSQVDLGDVFAVNGVKVVSVDMPPFMQIHAVDCARKTFDSMEKFTSKTLALALKKEFDGAYGPAWHCIVGTSFGSFVTHSVGGFLYFSMDQKLYVLLFKTTVQKAD